MFVLRYWLPVLVWMALIFSASSDTKSVQHSDGLLSHLLTWLHIRATPELIESLRWIVRKGAHTTEYAVLSLLCWRALRARHDEHAWSTRTAFKVVSLCILYAATDEFHQAFVKDRSASVTDVMIDGFGATLALVFVWLAIKLRNRHAS